MTQAEIYSDMRGTNYLLAVLDEEEQNLLGELRAMAAREPDWATFTNFYMAALSKQYESRGLTREEITKTPLWQIAQDIAGRLHIAQGHARPSDYRDELESLIRTEFGTRRQFCEATGLSEDMLSHVLAKRKNLGIQTLAEALGKIGYSIQIAPVPTTPPPMQHT